jgi:hypothetical protein
MMSWGTPKKLHTANDARALKQAIEAFHNVYGGFPDFGAVHGEARTEGEAGARLLTILLSKEDLSDSMQNKKQIALFNAKVNKKKSQGGLIYRRGDSTDRPEGLYDSWGNPFYLRMDTDLDGKLGDPFKQGNIVRAAVIVYSYGSDGKIGGGDDIQTW